MELSSAIFGLSPQNFPLKNLKTELSEKASDIFSKKSFSKFQETELSYIFLKKFFLYVVKGYSETWPI